MDDWLSVHYLYNYTAANQINKEMDMKYININIYTMIQKFGVSMIFKKLILLFKA